MFTTLGRMIVFGLQNFWRNIWLSLVTVIIVVLNLFLMSTVMGLNVVGQQTLVAVKSKVNLSVYFKPSISEERVDEVRQELLDRPEVKSIRLVSRAEHLEQAKRQSKLINSAVDVLGDNPLGAGLVISAKSLDGYGPIALAVKQPKYAALLEDTGNDFQTNQTVISNLSAIVDRLRLATLWLTILFGCIAILMVFNTIRVAIYSQREEIGIMKLVGASDAFVRGPFIITAILYGLLASLLTTAVLIPILTVLNPFFIQFFAGYDVNVLGYVRDNFWAILGAEVATGCGLSIISSVFAIGRYLRV